MDQLTYLAPVGVVLLSTYVYLGRLERSESLRLWILGFGALFVGALFILPGTPVGWALTSIFSAAFVALMYAGALRFTGRPIPAWLLPVTAALGVGRAATTLAGHPAPLSLAASLFSVGLLAVGGRVLYRHAVASEAGLAERALGPAMALLGVLLGASIGLRFTPIDTVAAFDVWILVAVLVALLQILSGLERTRRIETAQKQAIEQERRTLRAVLETAPLDIVLRDDDGVIRMANRSAAARFGIELDDDGEPGPGQVLPTELAEDLTARHGHGQRLADDPAAVIERAELVPPGRHDLTLEVYSSPVSGDRGESFGRLWIARDITQEKHLQHELLQSQKMETLGTLAGGVAHDFNNQLTTILGNARIAAAELGPEQSLARECLEDLERAADHCAEVTQGLLAFARHNPAMPEALSVAPLLGELESLLRASLPSRIQLDVEAEEGLWHPMADSTQLKQVLLNLAVNGRDAIPGAGRIRLSARNRTLEAPLSTVAGEAQPGRYVEFAVEDTGVGIDPSCLQYIFDPFFTTKPTGEGTGLGLAIAYGVVSSYGGFVDAESRPGHTALHVGIPAATHAPVRPADTVPAPPRGHGETVLLADDEPALRRLLHGQLEGLGYRVVSAECGERAVELAAEPASKIDVAVVDLAMPGMDGLETLEALRRDRPGLPGLIVSGYLDGKAERRVRRAADVLHKPFDAASLARAVRHVLDR
jgi:PAS domain S-box-containing protein